MTECTRLKLPDIFNIAKHTHVKIQGTDRQYLMYTHAILQQMGSDATRDINPQYFMTYTHTHRADRFSEENSRNHHLSILINYNPVQVHVCNAMR